MQHTPIPMVNNALHTIGILRLGALGDVCLTVPLVRVLQTNLKNTHIYWIISRQSYPLVKGLSDVNFIVIDKPQSPTGYWHCYKKLKQYRFDTLLVPQATLRSNVLCWFIKAKKKYGYQKLHSRDGQRFFVNDVVPSKREHLRNTFLRFATPFNINTSTSPDLWRLPIETHVTIWANKLLKQHPGKWLAICPTSSVKRRDWLTTRYIETINELAKDWKFNVILIDDSKTRAIDAAKIISENIHVPYINCVGTISLPQLTAVLAQVDVLLSPDTGPVHIATAMGTPVVGLYAVSSPEKTGPSLSQSWIVNKFPDAVKILLHKNPDAIPWHAKVRSSKAMQLITVHEVKEKLSALFAYLSFQERHILF